MNINNTTNNNINDNSKTKDNKIYKVVVKRITDFSKYQIDRKREEVFIYKKYEENVWFPSQLTSYLKTSYGTDSLSTKIKHGRWVCQFLNYINNEIEMEYNEKFKSLKEKGLYGLSLYHLADFINSFRNTNSYETVKEKENSLLVFYDYLYQLGITSEEAKIEKIPVPVRNGQNRKQVKWQIVNPFKGNPHFVIDYPEIEKTSSNVLKDMDEEVWNNFLEFAKTHSPHIVFGVAIQMFGGLRQGELVNLTIDSVTLKKDKNYIELNIDDRQIELFERGVDTRYSQVKKIRDAQPVFNFNGEIFELWQKHLEYIINHPKRNNMNALFLDSYGNSMTGQVYQKEFHKLKWDYIKFLEIECNKPNLADTLRNSSWGSHIGRHIFTNYLIKKGYLKNIMGYSDPKLLMILRGDSSVKSSEAYLDLKSITEAVADEIDKISSIASSMKFK